jgi:adenylate kinase
MDAIILLGAPGSGKGTVAEYLQKVTGYIHVSTGDMLRQAVKTERSVGLLAKPYIEKGELVPDDIIIKIVKDRIEQDTPEARYMFDGFPRTPNQAQLLDQVMAEHGARVSHVFLLDVPKAILIRRIGGRRICRQCGAVYNIHTMRSKEEGVCDQCGGELYQRPDDNEETIVNRLEVYQNQTASLIDYYRQKGLLVRVDSTDRVATEHEIERYLRGAS